MKSLFLSAAALFSSAFRCTGACFADGKALAFAAGLLVATLPAGAAGQTNLGEVNIGSSATAAVTVTIPGTATLGSIAVVTQGAANLDFTNAGGGSCTVGASYSADTCMVQVTFTPKFAGERQGAVVLADASNNVIGTAYLQGMGQGPQIAYSVAPSPPTSPAALPATLLGSATAVAVDDKGDVYIGDSGTGSGTARVLKETLVARSYTQSIVASNFYQPTGIATDGAGNVYVLDAGNGTLNSSTNAVYKETLCNGEYTQTVIEGVAPTTAFAVDGMGNIYYSGWAHTTAAGIYVATIQPDGSYALDTGPLPFPGQSSLVNNLDCGVASSAGTGNYDMNFTVDGNGVAYFNAYVECSSVYTQPSSYYFVFEYSSGITQPPAAIQSGEIAYATSEYLPILPPILVDGHGDLFTWLENTSVPWIAEEVPTATGYTGGSLAINLEGLYPYGVAVGAGGDVYVMGSVGQYSGAIGVYKLDYADAPTLTFQPTSEGVASGDSPRVVTVANIGNATLTFSGVSYPTDFPENSAYNNACASNTVLAAESFCLLPINFIPVTPLGGNQTLQLTESVTLNNNAANSPQSLVVAGLETLPPTATPAASPAAGTYTAAQSVTLTDNIAGAAIYYTIDGSMPTTSSSKYTGAIAVSVTETIQAIAMAAGYANSVIFSATYTINLPADFSVGIAPAALTISSAQAGTATLSVTPQGGFASAVSFSCSGLPSGATCSFSPATVTPSGGVASTTLTVSTSSAVSAVSRWPGALFPTATLAIAVCCLSWRKHRRVQLTLTLALGVFGLGLLGLGLLAGCGGGGSMTSQSTPSTVTVTGTAGSLQHNTTFSLTVQ
jgi:hypothetical protein